MKEIVEKGLTVRQLGDMYGFDREIRFRVYSCGRTSDFPLTDDDVEFNKAIWVISILSDLN